MQAKVAGPSLGVNNCLPGHRKCANNLQCIENHLIDDGENDCKDDSDELADNSCLKIPLNTTYPIIKRCPETPSVCLPIELYCDGIPHCPDGGDETESGCNCEDWGLQSCQEKDDEQTKCLNKNWLSAEILNQSVLACQDSMNIIDNSMMHVESNVGELSIM